MWKTISKQTFIHAIAQKFNARNNLTLKNGAAPACLGIQNKEPWHRVSIAADLGPTKDQFLIWLKRMQMVSIPIKDESQMLEGMLEGVFWPVEKGLYRMCSLVYFTFVFVWSWLSLQ